jgi:hypothetical protein
MGQCANTLIRNQPLATASPRERKWLLIDVRVVRRQQVYSERVAKLQVCPPQCVLADSLAQKLCTDFASCTTIFAGNLNFNLPASPE